MDTTTVNYAIEKLNEAFQAIKPTAVELGSEYIGYTVLKITIYPFLWGFFLLLATWLVVISFKDGNEDIGELYFGLGFPFGIISLVGFLITLYSAILANAYPLMYTIEQLAK